MKFNLLLYVPALVDNLDIEYGVFIQHHLMDDADIELNYFDFSRINSENYALDIVDKNEVTKKVRKDCLVEGFTLNSHYSINLDKGFNRSISKDEVRQIFICFKSNSKQPIDAFVRMTHDGETHNYHIKDNLIFFKLWVAPEMEDSSNIALNIGKINYSSFEYFRENIKEEINKQWHSMLLRKRDISKEELLIRANKDIDVQPEPALDQSNPVKLENIFVQPEDVPDHVNITSIPMQSTITSQYNTISANTKKGTDSFKIIAYILLILGVLSMLGKIFGGN
ncbi:MULTISPECIES: hypothetical protein [Psychrobacter]|uniref:Uncharacterized protein n=1 Tax=Psychrobacter alimentarius TaxID=261164 RepID=A0ABM5ZYL6_9GAMM|nr:MULTISPECIES: hypothetical protein [Psychrobacter]AMT97251.1 hypothetical protein A3K91_1651 [Psychrobacter alimentarius]QCB30427.1 hypothetical protein E5677_05135 [Psychrobacter sp. PAMC27889]